MKFLVTGAAGFIGSYVSKRLLEDGYQVFGVDNINDFYDKNLKKARLNLIKKPNFTFLKIDLTNREDMVKLFINEKFNRVIHLAAQAGVRFSIENPYVYADTNLLGYLNILEGCRHTKVQHLLYASSSSVYGLNQKTPFSTDDSVDHPISFYAATKRSNELMSHAYSHLYHLPTTGLRFFTVYGPWGRPDMALFKFTRSIIEGSNIDIYNHINTKRDFTYIDDIVEVIIRIQNIIPQINSNFSVESISPSISSAPYRIYNVGNNVPVRLMDFITVLENTLGIEAKKNILPMQPGDIPETNADTNSLYELIGFKPHTSLKYGVKKFVDWYKDFYNIDL